jgi:hypothetical protein
VEDVYVACRGRVQKVVSVCVCVQIVVVVVLGNVRLKRYMAVR